ncbi:putative acyl-CoA dehydrogenase [Xylaria arbuscula]|nr:putative acyl-CoA dehydrogenase [Xylaria arbuscula]
MVAPIPFSDPSWLMGLPSAYYTESHHRFQKAIRPFIQKHLLDRAIEWDKAGTVPEHVYRDFAEANMLLPVLPAPLPVAWLKRLGVHELLSGLKVEDFDYMHSLIYSDEMARSGLVGPAGSLTTGFAFGIPPILKFGDKQLQERVIPDLLMGKKRCCIAITEPDAGSDVANITTTATKSSCGKYYIVNGAKKWITNGIWADYASMAVRTGPQGSGAAGLSMLVVPLKNYAASAIKVPVENLIGTEGMGMRYVMTNFNHERLSVAIGVTRQARVALATTFEYVMKREAFGKPLMDQPVVRHRLAKAGGLLESQWAWVEQFAYQMSRMPKDDADRELGGMTGLLKAQAGIIFQECANTAVLLFGGNGYTCSGQGELIEMIYREVPGARIPGGSEDVLLDLAVRQLVKLYQAKTKALEAKAKF